MSQSSSNKNTNATTDLIRHLGAIVNSNNSMPLQASSAGSQQTHAPALEEVLMDQFRQQQQQQNQQAFGSG